MNTLIKPPCTNGTAQDRQPVEHLLKMNTAASAADVQKKAADKVMDLLTRDINWTDTTCYWMGDRHEESKIWIYDNAVKYARALGYMPRVDNEGRLNAPYIVKGFDYKSGKIDKQKFSCIYIAEQTESPAYASKDYIVQKFKEFECNWYKFRDMLKDSLDENLNNNILDDDSLTEEQILQYIDSHEVDFVRSLYSHEPYNSSEPWIDQVLCIEDWDTYIRNL